MEPERWHKINEVFFEALQREPSERDAYVGEACAGDAEMHEAVEELLVADSRQDQAAFLDQKSHWDLPGSFERQSDQMIGQPLGAYEIKELLGSGGMGNVYLAVRSQDYKQRVAIKLLKRGMDTDEILKRFQNEIRFHGVLGKHPNIAGMFDAGTTADGLPYFVMEYVEGKRIDQFCDERRVEVRDRLKLFQAICRGVQFAHRHTVIHRDLKPSNILVTAEGVPKLIDFGIAKLTDPDLSFATGLPTRTEFRFMTPEYASPEQVRGDALTTASDVYALGVVLYELLTGHRPFRLTSRIRSDLEQTICDSDPAKPSDAVVEETAEIQSSIEQTPQRIGEVRGTHPQQLRRMLVGDIDNIVLKALHKDPNRRYGSAEAFAEDIDRFLNELPVQARGSSRAYRCHKFLKRNRLAVSAAAIVAASLVVAVIGITTQWLRADANASLAASESKKAAAAQGVAEANLNKAIEAVDRMLTRVGQSHLAHLPQMERVRKDLLQDALEMYQGFLAENRGSQRLQRETAYALCRVGYINRMLGNHQQSLDAYEEGISILSSMPADGDADLTRRDAIRSAYQGYGILLEAIDRWDDAEANYRRAVALARELAADSGNDPKYQEALAAGCNNLGNLLSRRGDHEFALAALREALSIREKIVSPSEPRTVEGLISSYSNLAIVENQAGKLAAAKDLYRKGLAVYEKFQQEIPSSPTLVEYLAVAHFNLAGVCRNTNQVDDAREEYAAAIEMQSLLVRDFPAVERYAYQLAVSRTGAAALYEATQELDRAAEQYVESVRVLEALTRQSSDVSKYREVLAMSYQNWGQLLLKSNDPNAQQISQKGHDLLVQLVKQHPEVPRYLENLVRSYMTIGGHYRSRADWAKSLGAYRRAIDLVSGLVGRYPTYKELQASATYNLGVALYDSGQPEESEAVLLDCLKIREALPEDDPRNRSGLAIARYALANTRSAIAGRERDAELGFRQALEDYSQLTKDFPKDASSRHLLAQIHNNLANLLNETGRPTEAIELYGQAARLFRKLAEDHPLNSAYQFDLGGAWFNLGAKAQDRGDMPAAGSSFARAKEVFTRLVADHPRVAIYQIRLANTLEREAKLMSGSNVDGAVNAYLQTIAIRREVSLREGSETLNNDFARAHHDLGALLLRDEARHADAAEQLRQAAEIWSQLAQQSPKVPQYARDSAAARINWSVAIDKTDVATAQRKLQEACLTLSEIINQHPEAPSYCDLLRTAYRMSGNLYARHNQDAEAERVYRELVKLNELRVERYGPNQELHLQLYGSYSALSWFLSSRKDEAMRRPAEAVRLAQRAVESAPQLGAPAWSNLGIAQFRADNYEAAVKALNKAIELGPPAPMTCLFLAMSYAKQGDGAAASTWYEKAERAAGSSREQHAHLWTEAQKLIGND